MIDVRSIQGLYQYNSWANCRAFDAVAHLSQAEFVKDRFDEAHAALQRALELHPNLWSVLRSVGVTYARENRLDDAIATFEQALPLSGHHPWILADLAQAYASAGRRDDAHRMAEAGLAAAETRYVQPSLQASLLFTLGRADDAFASLDRACAEHDLLPILNYYMRHSSIQRDPRWPALMRRIGLVPPPEAGRPARSPG